MMTPSRGQRLLGRKASSDGFSLLELLVAMAVFLTVSAVSFTLFSRHQALLSEEQLTVGLNIGLRNALAQVQLDLVNSGNGLILGINVPAWPVGVTIQNSNPTPATCDPTASNPPVYAAACFDTLNVVLADRNTPRPKSLRREQLLRQHEFKHLPFRPACFPLHGCPDRRQIFIAVTRSFL